MADRPSASTAADTNVSLKPAAGGGNLWVMKREFDLDTLLTSTTKLINTDVVNLFAIPANSVILSCHMAMTRVAAGGTGTCTYSVHDGTDEYVAATDMLTLATMGPTTATFPQPIEAAVYCELRVLVQGGTLTDNGKIQITMVGIDCSSSVTNV
ncbi:MAG: hypothetical protein P1P84_02690 [Deferrisomatales bacterium]|nr:hypothetical protein [Deferrisomatales bacterium]